MGVFWFNKMEELLLSLPKEIETEFIDEHGKPYFGRQGLCVKYVWGDDKWVCKYGTPKSKTKGSALPHTGIGDTPNEAVANFVKLFRKQRTA